MHCCLSDRPKASPPGATKVPRRRDARSPQKSVAAGSLELGAGAGEPPTWSAVRTDSKEGGQPDGNPPNIAVRAELTVAWTADPRCTKTCAQCSRASPSSTYGSGSTASLRDASASIIFRAKWMVIFFPKSISPRSLDFTPHEHRHRTHRHTLHSRSYSSRHSIELCSPRGALVQANPNGKRPSAHGSRATMAESFEKEGVPSPVTASHPLTAGHPSTGWKPPQPPLPPAPLVMS
jgi:hypothetical protein